MAVLAAPRSCQGACLMCSHAIWVLADRYSSIQNVVKGRCSCTGAGPGDEHYVEPESPVFDEAFALDAQLILGSLVTPATAARPPAQSRAAPAEPAQQVGCPCFA